LQSPEIMLVPQIFRDNRGSFFGASASPSGARRIAFFFDAIPWRRPDLTHSANTAGVVEYMTSLANFDAVITASQEARDDLRTCWQSHLPPNRNLPPIHILLWPPDETFAKHSAMPVTAPAAEVARRPKILCVGTLEPRKNHLTLLAAAEQLWRQNGVVFELEIIGRTTAHFGEQVVAEVERLKAAGRPVSWRRHVDNDTLLKAYDECAFTVYPTLLEGYGLPIIESLCRGRPCVCGANGALGELAKDGGCLTVNQTDASALADGMRRLLTDETLYRRLCEEACAREFETWPGFVTKLMALSTRAALVK
jgi:glycosyltransferase involved in cell wall biosynthesis